jgi:hypothetical protein
VGGANIQIVHYFDHGYLDVEKPMIHSFTVTFGAKYLIGIVKKFKFLRYVTFRSRFKGHIGHAEIKIQMPGADPEGGARLKIGKNMIFLA